MYLSKDLGVDFFVKNRQKLLNKYSSDSLILLSAAQNIVRSADIFYPFHQNTSFYYFTGIVEAGCLLLFIPDSPKGKNFILFIPRPSSSKELWEGKMLYQEDYHRLSGIEDIEYLDNFFSFLNYQQNLRKNLYIESDFLASGSYLNKFCQLIQKIRFRMPGLEIKKIDQELAILRSQKNEKEIKLIRKAIEITSQSFNFVFPKIKKIKKEYQVAAELQYHYKILGSEGESFETIVACGDNAIILHYVILQDDLQNGALLLIDTGARWGMYNADISRTIPISGLFTSKQKKYYEVVLQMQLGIFELLKSKPSWLEYYKKGEEIQAKILKKEGIIQNLRESKALTVHRVGHSLGLDVHDLVNQEREMKVGTVLTVEPGLYLPQEKIGIRVEDNVLITKEGIENLSADIPKTIADLENVLC